MGDYKSVIERRKTSLEDDLLEGPVSYSLHTDALMNVCKELETDSCCFRNWRGLASRLIEPPPDKNTIDSWSKCESPAYELLSIWVEKCDDDATFNALLEAMTINQSYSSADELLQLLESLTRPKSIIIEIKKNDKEDEQEDLAKTHVKTDGEPTSSSLVTSSNPPFERSRSASGPRPRNLFGRIKRLWRSSSYPPDPPRQVPDIYIPSTVPKSKKDEIFIVSSSEDDQSEAVKDLKSFVRRLRPKSGNWRVGTIHDLPGGPATTSWLAERIEQAAYVIICCSNILKQISDQGMNENAEFVRQSEFNLKFTLDLLITGTLYRNMCYNTGGKFLPVLLPGNQYSCVLNSLAFFKVFTWPEELKGIGKYIMGKPERDVPVLGEKKPLTPCRLF